MTDVKSPVTVNGTFIPKLAAKARLKFDRHGKKYMILYPERGLELNEAAAAIAKKCDGTRAVDTIVEELLLEHVGGVRDTVKVDVLEFVTELSNRGLLTRG